MSIRVLIADDHALLRSGLRSLLDHTADIQVVAEASDGREALKLTEEHQPNIVLMDVGMSGLNGLEATLRTVKRHPHVRVIVLSMHNNEEYIVQALKFGASGYLLKDAAAIELETAIRAVMNGELHLSPGVAQQVAEYEERFGVISSQDEPDGNAGKQLTTREREVLQLIAEGHTMQEIANTLEISIKTVETHRYRLMDKLNIHHVTGLVRYAIRIGMVQPEL